MSLNAFDLPGIRFAEWLTALHQGYRAARVLQVAVELDVFTALAAGPATVDTLASQLGAERDPLERLLTACASLGLVERDGDRFRNSEVAETCLVAGRPLFQGDAVAHSFDLWAGYDQLLARVRPSAPATRRYGHFTRAMHERAIAGLAQQLARNVDLSSRRQLFDVGGGAGTFSVALCQRYPELRAVVFDRPMALAVAREVVEAYGLADRIMLRPGDWWVDDFGTGNDAVLLSSVMHGPGSGAELLLAKSYASMAPGGVLIVRDFLLEDGRGGPELPAFFYLQNGAYTVGEMLALIRQAGFADGSLVLAQARGESVLTARRP
jgi:hypothetical protein